MCVCVQVLHVSVLFWNSLSVCGGSFVGSSLLPVFVCLHVFVQVLYVTVLIGSSLCTIRRLMRSSQLSSTCSVMPLATRNFALIATLFAVAVSHVQPSTVICCPLQVDRVDLVGLVIRFMFRASSADSKLVVHPVSGTAVTLNGCMPSFLLSSHNSRGGVTEVFRLPPLMVL